ncbi:hypothetical protein CLV83_4029 [Marinobacterium mangrovicola]|uniref:Lactoylglutathione lyase n=1 Tax=Marinobacterium mangrovicola TaxID=1476959 RepID=A0A4V2PCX4_9GAMM|nr:hypothetical protein CLV83_4029 [Marinobacterium mangrovicola]
MNATSIKGMIQVNNLDESLCFYSEIGFDIEQISEDYFYLMNNGASFLIQHFYYLSVAKNQFLNICVSDIRLAHQLCSGSSYKMKISSIKQEVWGKVFYLWGPSRELLHVSQLSY